MNSSSKKENSFFTLFKQAFPKSFDFNESEVYHVKSFEYSDSNLYLVDKNIFNSNLIDILEDLEYNTQSDNIGMYYVVNSEGLSSMYLIYDPFELLSNERILKQYNGFVDDLIMKLNTVQRIY